MCPSLRRRLVGHVPRPDALALTASEIEDADFAVAAGRDAHLRVVVEHARGHLRVGRRGRRRLGRQVVFLARARMKFSRLPFGPTGAESRAVARLSVGSGRPKNALIALRTKM